MTPARRQQMLLGGLVAVLVIVLLWQFGGASEPAIPTSRPSNPAPPRASAPPRAESGPSAESMVADVRLELLQQPRGELSVPERNPFRFYAAPAPPRPEPQVAPRSDAPPPPPVQTGPPPPPPIPLRYIGLFDTPAGARVAVLSDGRGNTFYGKEGDIIEGRFRMLRVGPDSAELAYIDGRGRQTIRMSGQ